MLQFDGNDDGDNDCSDNADDNDGSDDGDDDCIDKDDENSNTEARQ